jgi:outer membrane protein OmpA-like peptidoglycan-associated protein
MDRLGMWALAAVLPLLCMTGCATKKYVNSQTEPLVEHANQLDQKMSANNSQLHDVDDRAQAGIKQAQGSADAASQSAQNAAKAAADAKADADLAVNRADSLASVVAGLDNYKPMGDVSVNFGFDKAVLTQEDQEQLDQFAAQLGTPKNFLLEVTGGTDSTGPAQYNYELSQRRADAVVQYLVSKCGIAPRRFYLIGIGKDKEVAPNTTAEGRRQNRRVEVRLLVNDGTTMSASSAGR